MPSGVGRLGDVDGLSGRRSLVSDARNRPLADLDAVPVELNSAFYFPQDYFVT